MNLTWNEANSIFEKQVLGRWPEYKPGETERGDWILVFQKYTEQQICKAVFTYRTEQRQYKKPDFSAIINYLKSLSTGNKKSTDPPVLFWLQREKDGALKPVMGEVGRTYSPDYISRLSQRTRERWSEFYKENWIIILDSDYRLNLHWDIGTGNGLNQCRSTEPAPDIQDDEEAGMMSVDELATVNDMNEPFDYGEDLPF